MQNYHELLEDVLENGTVKWDRTGTGTHSVFGRQLRFDLQKGFPLVTTKKVFWKGVAEELFWFLRGESNVKILQDKGVHIWDAWAKEDGELGPIYGVQWRSWLGVTEGETLDQITEAIQQIRDTPHSRRIVVTAWNPGELHLMALPPCHMFFQFYVADGKLSCHMYQRSADLFLGVPFNIASYALLTHLVAHVTNLEVGDFIHSFGDAHIYTNHVEQVKEQLTRDHRPLPKLEITKDTDDIFDISFKDLNLTNYNPHPTIKAPVAV